MKKKFNKYPAMNKNDIEDSESSTKCSICDKAYVDGDIKVQDYFTLKVLCRIILTLKSN